MPSVKIVERSDIYVILEILNEENDKTLNSDLLLQKERRKRAERKMDAVRLGFDILERESVPFL